MAYFKNVLFLVLLLLDQWYLTHMLGAVWKSALIKNTAIMTRINKIYTVNSLSLSLFFLKKQKPAQSKT